MGQAFARPKIINNKGFFNPLGEKLLYFNGKILLISPKQNFTRNTLGFNGLKALYFLR